MITRIVFGLAVSAAVVAVGADWPQYRGPNRDDIARETGLLKQWPADGPKLLWTQENTGVGLAGVAVVGDRVFTIGGRGKDEFLIALSAGDGKEVWATRVGGLFDFSGNQWSSGPSSTPTVDGENVYAVGGNGDLLCAAIADGKEVWRVNLPADFQAEVNPIGGGPKKLGWGFTFSPLVDGEKLIILPGGPAGTVAALDKKTGKVLWRSVELKDQAAYTSPMLATIEGVRQYVVITNQSVAGVAAEDGKLLWQYKPSPAFRTEVVNSPIVKDNQVFVTVGAGAGTSLLLKIARDNDAFTPSVVYENKNLMNHHGNVVLMDGHLFGHAQRGGFTCMNLQTGEVAWAEKRVRSGAIVFADGHFYNLSENDGSVTLLKTDEKGAAPVSTFKLPKKSSQRKPKGGIWAPVVVSNGKLFLRDQELLFCYDVKAGE